MRLHPLLLVLVVGCGGSSFVGAPGTSGAPDGSTDGSAAQADGSAVGDGGIVSNGGSPPNAGPGGNTQSIPCGNTTCAIPGEACCVFANQNPPPDFSYACVSGSVCPAPGGDSGVQYTASLQCTSAANCAAGQVCCMYEPIPRQVASECRATCSGPGQAQLCDPTVPASQSGCPASAPCSNANIGDWNVPSGFATCGGIGN